MSELEAYVANQLQDEYGMTLQEASEAASRQMERVEERTKLQPVSAMSREYLDSTVKSTLDRHLAVHHVPKNLARDMVANPELTGSVLRHPSMRAQLTQPPKTQVKPVLNLVRRVRT
jgi:hypothetical protein